MRRHALIDTAVVCTLGAAFVLLEACGVPKRWTFVGAALALAAFAVVLVARRADSWGDVGFRRDNLGSALLPIGACTLLVAAGILIWGRAHGRSPWRPDLIVLLPLYPVWGVVQQAVFQGVLHRRLMVLLPGPALPVLVTAVAFSAVHAGNATLVLLTFLAGLLWSCLFRLWPNVWALGLSHGILAALAYPLVLGDAPLARI